MANIDCTIDKINVDRNPYSGTSYDAILSTFVIHVMVMLQVSDFVVNVRYLLSQVLAQSCKQ